MSSQPALNRIAESLEHLASLVRSAMSSEQIGFEHLATEYLALRRSLARDFRELAERELEDEGDALEPVRHRISQRMRELYGGRVPDSYLHVRGYSGVHPILFAYLLRHPGEPVAGSRLRLLTGDQVHTERRLRELRDLGLPLDSAHQADDDHYVLRSSTPDVDAAALFQAKHNITNDRALESGRRAELLRALENAG